MGRSRPDRLNAPAAAGKAASLTAALMMLAGCAADTVDDRRRGQQIVCHDGEQTLTVSNANSFVHLDHGDTPGPCAAAND